MGRDMSSVAWLLLGLLASDAVSLCTAAPASSMHQDSNTYLERGFEDWAGEKLCKGFGLDNLDTYSPYRSDCPGDDYQWIRPADSLSSGEKEYLEKRKPKLEAAWKQRMKAVGLENALPEGRIPVVASALSGGGYRGEFYRLQVRRRLRDVDSNDIWIRHAV
jgi:hypothetical protein